MNLPPDLASRLVIYPSYDAWLAERIRLDLFWLGGTAVADICRVGYGSPWSVWNDYRSVERKPHDEAKARDLARGREWEEVVATLYQKRTGCEMKRMDWRLKHARLPWAYVSPDGLVRRDGTLGCVEIKTARDRHEWGDHGTEIPYWQEGVSGQIVPIRYACQVYWLLECSGLAWCDVVAAVSEGMWTDIRIIRIHRDADMQAKIVAKVTAWREHYLVGGQEPPRDDSAECRAHYGGAFRCEKPEPLRTPVNELEDEVLHEYLDAYQAQKEAEERLNKAANDLLAVAGFARGLSLPDGRRAVITRPRGKTPYVRPYGLPKEMDLTIDTPTEEAA